MKSLRCEKCGMTAARSWEWIWYGKTFTLKPSAPSGKPRTVARWLCPDCAGEFASDRTRNAFLRRTVDDNDE